VAGIGRERMVAGAWGVLFTGVLAVLIVAGSRRLAHFDAALVGYTFAVLFATFAVTYRYAMWLQRPPTRLYWRRGWQVFLRRGHVAKNVASWFRRVSTDFAANRFIFRRDPARGLAHALIMWGCLLAAAITFPLVFGWIHFETVPGDVSSYRTYLVVAGVMLAMRRRMRDHGAAAVQRVAEDFLPLVLLFAISVTGLLLTASYTWMQGYGYDFLALLHAVTVIFTLLYLPFGKFFHLFQRPAQLGVAFYQEVAAREAMAACRRCGAAYAPAMQIEDLIEVERELGYRYEAERSGVDHYQRICPACRRTLLALSQGALFRGREAVAAAGGE
jgi:hypothetical protein